MENHNYLYEMWNDVRENHNLYTLWKYGKL